MKLVAVDIRTTSDNLNRGNVVEFAAACCDVENPKERWASMATLIDNSQIVGDPSHLYKVATQLAEIGGERPTWIGKMKAGQVAASFKGWCEREGCTDDAGRLLWLATTLSVESTHGWSST